MNTNDDMHRFIAVLMRYGIIFSLLASLLLFCLAALLIWKPLVLVEILRYTIAAICVGAAFWIVVVLVGVLKRGKSK